MPSLKFLFGKHHALPGCLAILFRVGLAWLAMLPAADALAQLSFESPPIEYSKSEPRDPVALLISKIESGDKKLVRDSKTGYLNSLLAELKVPISSQTLVFSKTSLQRHLISPSNPRAIFFNDDTYVAWVKHGELIEIASIDPVLGTNFYTVEQSEKKDSNKITRKTQRCLFCHGSTNTGRIPGLLMQSVYSNSDGDRVFPSDSIWPKPDGRLDRRWAGWFVTGTHGSQQHLGNLMVDSDAKVEAGGVTINGNVTDLSRWFDVTAYPSPHSDLVALLVLQHQVAIHNLLTNANHRGCRQIYHAKTRNVEKGIEKEVLTEEDLIILDGIAEEVLDGLLMVGAVELTVPVAGTSDFANAFSKRGPRDSVGRSLRTLDLRTALFEYPCSYLIYSDSFDALPEPVLVGVRRRLAEVLSSQDSREKYRHLSEQKRQAILRILRETKPSLFVSESLKAEPNRPAPSTGR